LLCAWALSTAPRAPEPEEIAGDGKTKQEAADCVKPISLNLAGGVSEDLQNKTHGQSKVGQDRSSPCSGIALAIADAHGSLFLSNSAQVTRNKPENLAILLTLTGLKPAARSGIPGLQAG
jgi:hypothetical protein